MRDPWLRALDDFCDLEPLQTNSPALVNFEIWEARRAMSEDERRAVVFNQNARANHRKKRIPSPSQFLTRDEYLALKERSGGKCEICGDAKPLTTSAGLNIDHEHTTGIVRGILCSRCNVSLERMEHDPSWGTKALSYLSKLGTGAAASPSAPTVRQSGQAIPAAGAASASKPAVSS